MLAYYLWFIPFTIILYMMLIDENIAIYVGLTFKLIKVNHQGLTTSSSYLHFPIPKNYDFPILMLEKVFHPFFLLPCKNAKNAFRAQSIHTLRVFLVLRKRIQISFGLCDSVIIIA